MERQLIAVGRAAVTAVVVTSILVQGWDGLPAAGLLLAGAGAALLLDRLGARRWSPAVEIAAAGGALRLAPDPALVVAVLLSPGYAAGVRDRVVGGAAVVVASAAVGWLSGTSPALATAAVGAAAAGALLGILSRRPRSELPGAGGLDLRDVERARGYVERVLELLRAAGPPPNVGTVAELLDTELGVRLGAATSELLVPRGDHWATVDGTTVDLPPPPSGPSLRVRPTAEGAEVELWLWSRGRPVGLARWVTRRPPDDDALRDLERRSRAVAVLLDAALLLEHVAQLSADADPQAMATVLHDRVAQQLAAAALEIDLVVRRHPDDPELARAAAAVRDAVREVREVIRRLRIRARADRPWGEILATELDHLADRYGTTVRVTDRSDGRRPPLSAEHHLLHLLLAVAEGLMTAGARRVEVTLTSRPHRLAVVLDSDAAAPRDPTLVAALTRTELLGWLARLERDPLHLVLEIPT